MKNESPDGAPVVYFIGWPGCDVKIGFSRYVDQRLTEIIKRTGCPQQLLATTPGTFALERAYHERFAALRIHGEWFTWSDEIAAEIDRLNQIRPAPRLRNVMPALTKTHGGAHGWQ